jgi:hypothetical protein
MARFPFDFVGEYRGHSAAGEFTNDDGEKIGFAEGLKFEVDLPDGDVELVVVRVNKLDAVAEFDATKLVKGERIHFVGVVNVTSFGARPAFLKAEKTKAAAAA